MHRFPTFRAHPLLGCARLLIPICILATSVVGTGGSAFVPHPAAAATSLLFTAVDTMKESRDTETRPLTDAQIADDVHLAASLGPSYITVDTHWEYPDYMRRWVATIRAAGKRVWFRFHPNQWGNNNGTTGIMTPAAYESAERTFLAANLSLFQPGDVLDSCPEPENGLYWKATYNAGWTTGAPNTATRAYNAFIRDTTDIADAVLQQAGIYGVITTVRSTNAFFATHPGALEAATVSRMGRVTVDSYPEGTTTDPATAAGARVGELNTIEGLWGVPVVIGELGYSNRMPVDDQTQASVLSAELAALAPLTYLQGLNYWVGAGTDASGGYTHLFAGSTGAWSLRPAASAVSSFFGAGSGAVPTPTSPPATASPSWTASGTPLPTATPAATASASASPTDTPTPTASPSLTAIPTASPTRSSTPTAVPTRTPIPAASATPSATGAPSTFTVTPTARPTASPSATLMPSATASPTAQAGSCPPGWSCADVGSPALQGSQLVASGVYTVLGAGQDIWGSYSQFRYLWRPLPGDGSLSARVRSQSNTSPWAKAGLMLSQNAAPDSPYYALFITPDHGLSVQYRAVQGANALDLLVTPAAPPVYLRVARTGTTFAAFTSADGANWTLIPGSARTLDLAGPLLSRLAVTSHNPSQLGSAEFDAVAAG